MATIDAQIQELITKLNYYTEKYDAGVPEISDEEWDNLYFQLVELEKQVDYKFDNSPTNKIYYEIVNELKKVEHDHQMLSLDKTKNIDEVKNFVGNHSVIIMAKMDGLTCSLTYQDGILIKAETRGNGVIGEDVLHNAKVIKNIPKKIPYQNKLVIDGEIICTYHDFEEFSEEYKNPRNFAAGSIRLLNSQECANRKLTFIAWDVIEGFDDINQLNNQLIELSKMGFYTVPAFIPKDLTQIDNNISYIQEICQEQGYPIDGIVFKFNDNRYRKTCGATSHHFKDAIAYKFYDEEYETVLLDIEWSMGRTGVLTPVAIFESIDIDGSTVSRANLHNVSVLKETLKEPYVGQKIWIYKANMIIPQIAKADLNIPDIVEAIPYPKICPICGSEVSINSNDNVLTMVCNNPDCEGKFINKLDHYCGKKGLDIRGLSKATLEKLIDWDWLRSIKDIYSLKSHRIEWIHKPGFGVASVDNILNAIEDSRICELSSFICAIGVPLIGKTVSKELAQKFETYEDFREAIDKRFNFAQWDGYAGAKTDALLNFDYSEFDKIRTLLTINNTQSIQSNKLDGKKFVITGSLKHFKNRSELQAKIEELGGKVVGSVSKNTDYLINNDVNSTSSKNVSAKKLNIPILTEEDFLKNFLDI